MCSPGGSWVRGSPPENAGCWKQASRVIEVTEPLEMVQLVGRYGPPRSIYRIHEQAFALFALISIREGSRVSPHEQ